jgi:GxxExxY protein
MKNIMNENELSKIIVDKCLKIHRALGPGLLESVYEEVLSYELMKDDLKCKRQVGIPVIYEDIKMDLGFRADMIVGDKVILELKSVENIMPVHKKQPPYEKVRYADLFLDDNYPHRNYYTIPVAAEEPVLTITIGGAVCGGVVLALVVALFIKHLNKRLRPILEECSKVAGIEVQGEATPRQAMERMDELSILAHSFNRMTAQVNALIGSLEERVKERTAELAVAKERAGESPCGRIGKIGYICQE